MFALTIPTYDTAAGGVRHCFCGAELVGDEAGSAMCARCAGEAPRWAPGFMERPWMAALQRAVAACLILLALAAGGCRGMAHPRQRVVDAGTPDVPRGTWRDDLKSLIFQQPPKDWR